MKALSAFFSRAAIAFGGGGAGDAAVSGAGVVGGAGADATGVGAVGGVAAGARVIGGAVNGRRRDWRRLLWLGMVRAGVESPDQGEREQCDARRASEHGLLLDDLGTWHLRVLL